MTTTLQNTRREVLEKDIPFGESIGILVGKTAGGVFETIKSPGIGLSQGAGLFEGFFKGVREGMEISAANFEMARIEGRENKLKKDMRSLQRKEEELVERADQLRRDKAIKKSWEGQQVSQDLGGLKPA